MKKKPFNVLVVDDTPKNIQVVASILQREGYDIAFATNGNKALECAFNSDFDLILLDIMMPELDGYETCKRLKNNIKTKNIPVIFLTAKTDNESIVEGFRCGGIDYILKPFNQDELIARVKTHLALKAYETQLEDMVTDLTHEIEETQKEIVHTMGTICETRSKETGNHVKRVAQYSYLFALYTGMSKEKAELIRKASPMHDIGKIGIPDAILHKPGKLDIPEWEVMKSHAILGYEMLKSSDRAILKAASGIAKNHHEKFDGSGYPEGLSGENIPIFGRITALADVFDALGSSRCYKKVWSDEEIFRLLKKERGKHFDPLLIDLFFEHIDEFLAVRTHLADDNGLDFL